MYFMCCLHVPPSKQLRGEVSSSKIGPYIAFGIKDCNQILTRKSKGGKKTVRQIKAMVLIVSLV